MGVWKYLDLGGRHCLPLGGLMRPLGSLWGAFGSLRGALGSIWGALGSLRASTLLPLGCPWVPLGRPWVPLGRPWDPLRHILQFCQNWTSNSEHLALKSAACQQKMTSKGSSADSADSTLSHTFPRIPRKWSEPGRSGPGFYTRREPR